MRTTPRKTPPAETPLQVLWQPRVLLWTVLVGEGLALFLAMAPGSGRNTFTYFGLASILIQWISLASLGTLYLFRSRLYDLRPQLVAWIALALVIASTIVVTAAAAAVLGADAIGTDWRVLVARHALLAFVVGLLALGAFQNHWAARQAAVRAKDAELQALQARIRPHFLFNTLNTAAALVHSDPSRVERLLLDLSDLFRAALGGPKDIPLAEELLLVRRYLEIEEMRFGPRLNVVWSLPPDIPDVYVPTLSVQPLAENGIRHGIERCAAGGTLEIAVIAGENNVEISVRNTGSVEANAASAGHRVGLRAVQARIEAMTAGRGSVTAGQEGDTYVARIRLPWVPDGQSQGSGALPRRPGDDPR